MTRAAYRTACHARVLAHLCPHGRASGHCTTCRLRRLRLRHPDWFRCATRGCHSLVSDLRRRWCASCAQVHRRHVLRLQHLAAG